MTALALFLSVHAALPRYSFAIVARKQDYKVICSVRHALSQSPIFIEKGCKD
ncbi:hypothetical protein GCM10011391_37520 [Pullulanibacillus camelliae]|uniref:Uncharacterized protein n=1 Tax=Pullulanibacillus camelliae TaxID=1707096 RepID=A0A8J2YMS5_9BACL|nr:hypothetical protein GCM10011391_37520 [Pullulanibacillus camelliae]